MRRDPGGRREWAISTALLTGATHSDCENIPLKNNTPLDANIATISFVGSSGIGAANGTAV